MSAQQISCANHGVQEFAIACIHVCKAIESGEAVGFFWDPQTKGPRPDAWCRACERWNVENPDAPLKDWMKVADFKIMCVRCWDEAKSRLYGQT